MHKYTFFIFLSWEWWVCWYFNFRESQEWGLFSLYPRSTFLPSPSPLSGTWYRKVPRLCVRLLYSLLSCAAVAKLYELKLETFLWFGQRKIWTDVKLTWKNLVATISNKADKGFIVFFIWLSTQDILYSFKLTLKNMKSNAFFSSFLKVLILITFCIYGQFFFVFCSF